MSEFFFIEESLHCRLDQFLAEKFKGSFSRTYFQQLIDENLVLLNGEPAKKRAKPKAGDEVEIQFILPKPIDLTPQNIPLDIIYEDSDLILVNKPAGMVVHPALGHYENTFVHALLWHCKHHLPSHDTLRPGIVHRLDKDTSGLLLAAKTPLAHQQLVEAFSCRKVKKKYLALTIGHPGDGEIRTLIGRDPKDRQKMAVVQTCGKEAITSYRTMKRGGDISQIEVNLITGRTHQIRVHMHHLKTPILGDPLYGSKKWNEKHHTHRQLLHAWKINFIHPKSGNMLDFEAPIPSDFEKVASQLN